MGQDFINIFTHMGIVSIIAISVGLVLLLLNVFIKKIAILGIPGIICMIVGMIFRIVDGTNLFQTLTLVGIMLFIAIIILTITIREFVQRGTAVPINYADVDENLLKLKGEIGRVTIDCRPTGRAIFDGREYEVKAYGSRYIISGSEVVVVDVTGEGIIVDKVKSDGGSL